MLASNVSITTEFPGLKNEASTFDVYVNSGPFSGGWYDAWCLNADIDIKPNTNYSADIYASNDLTGLQTIGSLGAWGQNVDNMGSISWLLNWYDGSNQGINPWEVQSTVWKLLGDDWTPYFTASDVDASDIEQMYQTALQHNDFVPSAGQSQFYVLDLKGSNGLVQPLILEKTPPVPEASTYAMLLGGLLLLGTLHLKKMKASRNAPYQSPF